MKLYCDMNANERRVSEQILAFALEMQKLAAEDRMAIWDDMPKEQREQIVQEDQLYG